MARSSAVAHKGVELVSLGSRQFDMLAACAAVRLVPPVHLLCLVALKTWPKLESQGHTSSGRVTEPVIGGGRVAKGPGRVAELFAGVGGFRLGLEGHAPAGRMGSGWRVAWSNQWEPGTKKQHASDCYVSHFGDEGHVNEDIATVLDAVEGGRARLPKVDLVVGGFPCQDYSVARVLSQAAGLVGKKGVLWWEILRFLKLAKPRFIFLENVDRLLKSPANQRGRDFAVMLHCLSDLGYLVEWRVVNAADYGFPQRRRRTFIVGERLRLKRPPFVDALDWLLRDGVLAAALPANADEGLNGQIALGLPATPTFVLPKDVLELSRSFKAEFRNAGVMYARNVWTLRVEARYQGTHRTLGDILQPSKSVPSDYLIPETQLAAWRYLKGAKREERTVASSGFKYYYTEGAVPFPERLNEPSRTILTGEGGLSPSRFKHVIKTRGGRYRRLTPVELERLNGFPDNWTNTGMPSARRAFMMGNALIVGVVERIGREIARRASGSRLESDGRVATAAETS
jgi:DNA (cytosine-5)-methyltransferase 1